MTNGRSNSWIRKVCNMTTLYTPDYEYESVSATCVDTDSDETYEDTFRDMMNIIYTCIYEHDI
jgi:hypothetical protein